MGYAVANDSDSSEPVPTDLVERVEVRALADEEPLEHVDFWWLQFVGPSGGVRTGAGIIGRAFGRLGTAVENPGILIKGFRGSVVPGHAIGRIIERGVTPRQLLATMRSPAAVLRQGGGRFLYVSRDTAVVITSEGQVVTAYTAREFQPQIIEVLRAAGALP